MTKAKTRHDRQIRKFEYQAGDLVLCDHPRLKRGLASGLAHKYYGPFRIVEKRPNNVDYVLKRIGTKSKKKYQVHKNRLKIYFGNKIIEDSSPKLDKKILQPSGQKIVGDHQKIYDNFTNTEKDSEDNIVFDSMHFQDDNRSLSPSLIRDAETEQDSTDDRIYCICQQESFGHMILCDNVECSIKWFHFPFVDIHKAPKGRWYCGDCKTLGFEARGRPRNQ